MSSFDVDPEQSISLVAIVLFFDAVFLAIPVLASLFRGAASPLLIVLVAALVAAGTGLLKRLRWAWPLALAALGLDVLVSLLFFGLGGLLRVLFDAAVIYLLLRPNVRERFSTR